MLLWYGGEVPDYFFVFSAVLAFSNTDGVFDGIGLKKSNILRMIAGGRVVQLSAPKPVRRQVAMGSTVTRADLSELVYEEVGLSRNESAELVESVLDEISDVLVEGEMVKVSSFGNFVVRKKGERIGRNPKTGEEVRIPPRRVLIFKASHVLKEKINESLS